jgi:hypothetical protein
MNTAPNTTRTRHRQTHRVALASAALGLLVSSTTLSTASATQAPSLDTDEPQRSGLFVADESQRFYIPCNVDPAQLPRTADAAEHWLRNCYSYPQLPPSDGTDREVRALMHRR